MQTAHSGVPALQFQNTRFDIVDRYNRPWLRAQQIGEALGYTDDKSINRIFTRHSDEFSDRMTGVVKVTTSGNLQTEQRIFSLRGAYLIGMHARTEVAKEFRSWALDVLEANYAVPPAPTFDKAKTILHATQMFGATVKMHTGLSLRQSYLLAASAAQEAFGVDLLAVWKLDPATLSNTSPQFARLARSPKNDNKRRLLEKLLRYIEAAEPVARHADVMKRMHLTAKDFRALVEDAVASGMLAKKPGTDFNYAGTVYVLVGGAA